MPRLRRGSSGRRLGQLPRRERHGRPCRACDGEPLLLGGGDHLAVDDERGRRIVEHSVDPQHPQRLHPSRESGGEPLALNDNCSPIPLVPDAYTEALLGSTG